MLVASSTTLRASTVRSGGHENNPELLAILFYKALHFGLTYIDPGASYYE
jgi:hypothetical protein